MNSQYHETLVRGQFGILERRLKHEDWRDVAVSRRGNLIFVELHSPGGGITASYLCRIDTAHYPVQPYQLGFLDPRLSTEERILANDCDPRYWPFSFFPGLEGSFHIAYQAPYMAFWCRPCTVEYFYYHGDETWKPAEWPLDRVVAHLRKAVKEAKHPQQWRPLQAPRLHAIAEAQGVALPEDAGVGNA